MKSPLMIALLAAMALAGCHSKTDTPVAATPATVNVQHLESLNDQVARLTGVRVRETVPDRVLEMAEIEVVDIPPDELIERLKAGKVYLPAEATRALGHYLRHREIHRRATMPARNDGESSPVQGMRRSPRSSCLPTMTSGFAPG